MPRPVQPILEVNRLSIRRGTTRILRDINWRVEPGQHWAILGANGSGKTSLLRSITGYFMPTDGAICLLGRRYGEADWRELRKRVGLVSSAIRQLMVGTEPGLETVISGKNAIIDFWGRSTRVDKERALKLLRQTECGHLAKRPWLYLSQGERQRVLIARALMARPQLLILDEPCAGLDPAAREHFLQFLQRLGKQPAAPTLVLVTHHVEEIMPVFSHVLVLRNGKVLASGRKKTVLESSILSRAFGTRMRLGKKAGRYSMTVARNSNRVV